MEVGADDHRSGVLAFGGWGSIIANDGGAWFFLPLAAALAVFLGLWAFLVLALVPFLDLLVVY